MHFSGTPQQQSPVTVDHVNLFGFATAFFSRPKRWIDVGFCFIFHYRKRSRIHIKNVFAAEQESSKLGVTKPTRLSVPNLLDITALDPMPHIIMVNNMSHIFITSSRNIIIDNSQIQRQKEVVAAKKEACRKKAEDDIKEEFKCMLEEQLLGQRMPYGYILELQRQRRVTSRLQVEHNNVRLSGKNELQKLKSSKAALEVKLKNAKELLEVDRQKFESDQDMFDEALTERNELSNSVTRLEDDIQELQRSNERQRCHHRFLLGLVFMLILIAISFVFLPDLTMFYFYMFPIYR